jgi:acyl-CoA synthetase (AMP-forming)/AMP-acid ligase II
VRVVDPATSELQPPDVEGLLLARGPGRMLGYETDDGSRAATGDDRCDDGWFATGDRAILDKDAFLTITAPRAAIG